jgi:hypothetical protein
MARRPMDPFARKMWKGAFIYGGVLLVMFAVLTVIYLHTRPRCSDRVVGEAASPSKQWTATIMERRCGEDAPFFTHLNIRSSGEPIKRGFFSGSATEGEIFVIEQDAASSAVALRWTDPNTLVVHCPRCDDSLMRKRDERWDQIQIRYDSNR